MRNIVTLTALLFISALFTSKVYSVNSDIVFSHERGFFTEPFDLTISTSIEGATIKYTLNGDDPGTSFNSFIYNASTPIRVDPLNFENRDIAPGFIVSTCVVLGDSVVAGPVTQTYLFINRITTLSQDNQIPGPKWLYPQSSEQQIDYGLDPFIYNDPNYSNNIEDAFFSIPTLSLVTDLNNLFNPDTGIYVNAFKHGREWERPSSLELLNPDGTEGFQINCGIRIRGGWSRHPENPKRAFRIFFRSEYGEGKLDFPLFGVEGTDQFDKIDLRTAMNYSWSYSGDDRNTFIRDVFSRDTQREMGQPYTRSVYYHLFINGTYWGLYQTQERSEASYGESYFGGLREDYDVIKVDVGEFFNIYQVEATDGTLGKWKNLWDLGEIGFSDDEIYFKAQGLNLDGSLNPGYDKLLDVDNLIDYMIITFFVGDFDGPISGFRNNLSPNNFYAIINRNNPAGFKFFRHDAEHSLFIHDWGNDRTGPFPAGENFPDSNPQWFHQKLSDNIHYRLRFADRVYKHLFNEGALTYNRILERIDERKSQIDLAIIAESARWGDAKVHPPRNKEDWLNAVEYIKNSFLPERKGTVLQQLITKGLFNENFPPQFSITPGLVDKGSSVELTSDLGDIYFTTDGTDPLTSGNGFQKYVVTTSTQKKVFVPKSDIGNTWYTQIQFDDASWQTCIGNPGGIGYETDSGYESMISLSVESEMHSGTNPNTSCYVRIPFQIDLDDYPLITTVTLEMLIDDGFVAYLNGTEVASFNAPQNVQWNSTSSDYTEADQTKLFDLSSYIGLLNPSTNLLAIHGLNTSIESSDFLILPKLSVGNTSLNGTVSESAIKYSDPIVIDESVIIKTRSVQDETWSVLNEAKFIIDEDFSDLKITELHYHPLDEDIIDGREYEFIELKNTGSSEINLTAAKFSSGINYEYPQGTNLAPGGFIVLSSNSQRFTERYSFEPFGEYEGQLNNGGELITLQNAASTITFSFRYNDKTPWPTEPDGEGFSLVSSTKSGLGNPATSDYWVSSSTIHGSPGSDDLVSNIKNKEAITQPTKYQLYSNYPNPFNPTTTIRFDLPIASKVKLEVFNVVGESVRLLANKKMNAGSHSIDFNANSLGSGIYFYKLSSNEFSSVRKMILIK